MHCAACAQKELWRANAALFGLVGRRHECAISLRDRAALAAQTIFETPGLIPLPDFLPVSRTFCATKFADGRRQAVADRSLPDA